MIGNKTSSSSTTKINYVRCYKTSSATNMTYVYVNKSSSSSWTAFPNTTSYTMTGTGNGFAEWTGLSATIKDGYYLSVSGQGGSSVTITCKTSSSGSTIWTATATISGAGIVTVHKGGATGDQLLSGAWDGTYLNLYALGTPSVVCTTAAKQKIAPCGTPCSGSASITQNSLGEEEIM